MLSDPKVFERRTMLPSEGIKASNALPLTKQFILSEEQKAAAGARLAQAYKFCQTGKRS